PPARPRLISAPPEVSGNLPGGGVSERPKENASKAFVGASPPRVQIPPPPPIGGLRAGQRREGWRPRCAPDRRDPRGGGLGQTVVVVREPEGSAVVVRAGEVGVVVPDVRD